MKILFVCNKTLDRAGIKRLEATYYNFYVPFLQLGHQVEYYDTIEPIEKDFSKVVDRFKPDLIFSILTGNNFITPYEPIKEIKKFTSSGLIKTFNWFCDDTWRYESFSKHISRFFFACSTPEPSMVEQYKQDGYNNILIGNWHVNLDIFVYDKKRVQNDLGFVGGLNQKRYNLLTMIQNSGFKLGSPQGSTHEDMLASYVNSRIGLNFTVNENDPQKKTQMKLRMFEVPACKTMLLTQNHPSLEHFFEINKEIVTFETEDEMLDKARYYLNNSTKRESIALAGYNRVEKEHTSQKRLAKLLEELNKL